LATLRSVGQAQCAQTTTIGCSQPPLGIEPTWTNLNLPDLARAKLRVTEAPGPGAKTPVGMVRGGSIELDFSAPALRAACEQWEPLALPNPRLQVSVRTAHSEICALPRTGPLVANP
jgi:hypothetical protein